MSDFRFSPRANRANEIAWHAVGARRFRSRHAGRQADSARDLGGVVPLVPRDGRNDVLRCGRDRSDQPSLRSGARRQRSPSRRQRSLQHGRLADDGIFGARWNDAYRCDLPAASADAPCPRRGRRLLSRAQARNCRTHRQGNRSARRRCDRAARRSRSGRRPDRAPARRPPGKLRPRIRGLRQRAEVPATRGSRVFDRRMAPRWRPGFTRHGGAHALGDGTRWNVRPCRGRLLPLLNDARLERAALREDGRRSRRPHPGARRSRALCAERRTP